MPSHPRSEVLIIGAGLAGLVTALECLRAGRSVTLLDRDTPQRLGGLARWAFGGMCLVDTPLQRRKRIPDSPERALQDWLRFGELDASELWPQLAGIELAKAQPVLQRALGAVGDALAPLQRGIDQAHAAKGPTRQAA